MANVNTNTKLPVSADMVWTMIGQFNGLPSWHPAIEKSEETREGETTIRKLTLAGGGGTVTERLERLDDGARSYTYSIVSGPIPVANYTATIKVIADGPMSCTVEWSSEFDPEGVGENEAVDAIRGIYEAGMENLKKMYGG